MTYRNFDEDRARPLVTFTLNGAEFRVLREIRPESLSYFQGVRETEDNLEAINLADRAIKACLFPDDRERWDAMRAIDGEGTLGTDTIVSVMDFVLEAATGRPTQPSLPSPNGSATTETGTTSTADSSSPEVAVSPA